MVKQNNNALKLRYAMVDTSIKRRDYNTRLRIHRTELMYKAFNSSQIVIERRLNQHGPDVEVEAMRAENEKFMKFLRRDSQRRRAERKYLLGVYGLNLIRKKESEKQICTIDLSDNNNDFSLNILDLKHEIIDLTEDVIDLSE